jgi:signal transduction histidine kinase
VGQEVSAAVFSREDRQRYRQKVRTCLDVFARMLRESRFDSERRSVGLEIELNLTDELGDPAMVNARALEAIAEAASAFVEVHQGVREQFIATLTHDFRGPLGAAQNYLELIRRAGEKSEQRAHFAARASENLKRIDRMIDDLLDVSRVTTGRVPLQPEVIDLSPA